MLLLSLNPAICSEMLIGAIIFISEDEFMIISSNSQNNFKCLAFTHIYSVFCPIAQQNFVARFELQRGGDKVPRNWEQPSFYTQSAREPYMSKTLKESLFMSGR